MVRTMHRGRTPRRFRRSRGFIHWQLGLLFIAPAALGAQQGTITYTHSINLDLELPPEMAMMADEIPSAVTQDMLLHFDPSASLMVPAPKKKRREEEMIQMAMVSEMAMVMSRLKIGGKSASAKSPAAESYVDLDEGRMVETHKFMGRTFRVADQRPAYEWRLTSEKADHLGYMVIKATAEHDSTAIEAWFTPQIPVGGGPGPYGGLPGMILVVSVDDGHIKYFATDIVLEDVEEGLIRRPEKGDEMSQEEYDEMVEEKTEEMRKRFGGRRRGVGGDR